jgi:hypothetical protein
MVTILPVRFLLYTLNVKRDRLPGDQESRATQNTLEEQAYKTELLASSQHISWLQIFGAAQNSQEENQAIRPPEWLLRQSQGNKGAKPRQNLKLQSPEERGYKRHLANPHRKA